MSSGPLDTREGEVYGYEVDLSSVEVAGPFWEFGGAGHVHGCLRRWWRSRGDQRTTSAGSQTDHGGCRPRSGHHGAGDCAGDGPTEVEQGHADRRLSGQPGLAG